MNTRESEPIDETEHEDPTSAHPDVTILLLAAGASSRMGTSKQLLDIGGTPLLRHTTKIALSTKASKVVVVLGANEPSHREVISDLPVHVVVNHYWKGGMGSSIKTGLHYVIGEHGETDAMLIMVCDQPALTAAHLDILLATHFQSGKKITASAYDDTLGVPAIFGRSFFSNILMLRDEQGAKKIIEQFKDQVIPVAFPEGSIDLDTAADYTRYRQENA